jgi:ornithine carbamoyltransferase
LEGYSKSFKPIVDGIMIRLLHEETLEFVKYATVPVINGADRFSHPTRALADFLAILGKKKRFDDVKYVLSWGYEGEFLLVLLIG